MPSRSPVLQNFLTALDQALLARPTGPDESVAVDRIRSALQTTGKASKDAAQRLPVCRYLPDALATARTGSAVVAGVADAFAALEPALNWNKRSSGGPNASSTWPEGHANTMIAGPKGLEDRDDLWIGATLLAPHVRYPDHNHAPEEVYLVLSPGRFQHGDSGWFEPGVGGTLYNVPNITHAMASDAAPLFAIWSLWAGEGKTTK